MLKIEKNKLAYILFAETGCMVRGKDLTNDEASKIDFLILSEDRGKINMGQFSIGMLLVCNQVMLRMGFINREYQPEHLIQHRRLLPFYSN